LENPLLATKLQKAWDEITGTGDAKILCRTIMPNHVHVLLIPGCRLSLGQIIGKWKTRTNKTLAQSGLSWQHDFFERRLRPEDAQEAFGLYIFLNPYRAKLVGLREQWPWWQLDSPVSFEFPTMLRDGRHPHAEWLGQIEHWRHARGW